MLSIGGRLGAPPQPVEVPVQARTQGCIVSLEGAGFGHDNKVPRGQAAKREAERFTAEALESITIYRPSCDALRDAQTEPGPLSFAGARQNGEESIRRTLRIRKDSTEFFRRS